MAFTESFETINGCKTRFMRGGKGAPAAVPAWRAAARAPGCPSWRSCRERFEMIVPEHPGFGGSDTPGLAR